MSKMGISLHRSYRGAQLFEIVGLAREVVELCFRGTPAASRAPNFAEIAGRRSAHLPRSPGMPNALVEPGGLLQVRARRRVPHVQPRRGARLQARGAARAITSDYREYADP
jgi:glutamate synthase (NADPH/NADH) large chain